MSSLDHYGRLSRRNRAETLKLGRIRVKSLLVPILRRRAIPNTERGRGKEPDEERFQRACAAKNSDPGFAFREFEELASLGSRLARLHLAGMYRRGDIVASDHAKAEEHYRKAAQSGSLAAYYNLGSMYLNEQRISDAFSVLSYAAGKGYPPALNLLAKIYLKGIGVTRDVDRAEKLFERAALRGSVLAKGGLAYILVRDRAHPLRMLRGALLRVSAAFEVFVTMLVEGPDSERLR